MKQIEQEIQVLKTAHSRLHNQYQNLLKDYQSIFNYLDKLNEKQFNFEKLILEQIEDLKEIKPVRKPEFIAGNIYTSQISEVFSEKEVYWNNGKYLDYEIKFKGREEIYLAFISIKYRLLPNFNIKFMYEGNGKLRNVKII